MAAATSVKFNACSTIKCEFPKEDEKFDNSALITDKEITLDISSIPPNFVLVSIKAAGLNPVDRLLQIGAFGEAYFQADDTAINKTGKTVLGHDFAGIIEAVGKEITDAEYKKGDSVFGIVSGVGKWASNGAFAEKLMIHKSFIAKIPDELDNICKNSANNKYISMATMGVAGLTAYEALTKSQLSQRGSDASVFIAGASGGVGSFITQMCLNVLQSNKNVYVTAGSQKSIDYCINILGVAKENVIKYREFNGDVDKMVDYVVKQLNNGRLVDCVYDNVGGLMKVLCGKLVGIRGSMTTIVGEQHTDDVAGKATTAMAKDIFSFVSPNSYFITKSASLHPIYSLAPASSDEYDIAVYANDLKDIGDLIANKSGKKDFIVKVPDIAVLKGMNAKNVCKAMIQLFKGIQGKIIVAVE